MCSFLESFPVKQEAAGSLPGLEILVADSSETWFYCDSESSALASVFWNSPFSLFPPGPYPALSELAQAPGPAGDAHSRVRSWPDHQ